MFKKINNKRMYYYLIWNNHKLLIINTKSMQFSMSYGAIHKRHAFNMIFPFHIPPNVTHRQKRQTFSSIKWRHT